MRLILPLLLLVGDDLGWRCDMDAVGARLAEVAMTQPPRARIAPTALSEQVDAALVVARRSRS